jgi:hypothetical protein
MGRCWHAQFLQAMGGYDAREEMERAKTLAPMSPVVTTYAAWFCFAERDPCAKELCLKAISMDPGFWMAHEMLGNIYEADRLNNEAFEEWVKAKIINGASQRDIAVLRRTYMESGVPGFYGRLITLWTQDIATGGYVRPSNFALAYASMGDNNQALDWLEKAYVERDWYMMFLKATPEFDGIRVTRRFEQLERRMNFRLPVEPERSPRDFSP